MGVAQDEPSSIAVPRDTAHYWYRHFAFLSDSSAGVPVSLLHPPRDTARTWMDEKAGSESQNASQGMDVELWMRRNLPSEL